MANKGRKIIAYTTFSSRIFESVTEVLEAYGITHAKLQKHIESGQTLEDGMTTFDELYEPEEPEDERN